MTACSRTPSRQKQCGGLSHDPLRTHTSRRGCFSWFVYSGCVSLGFGVGRSDMSVQKRHRQEEAASMNTEPRTATASHTPGPWTFSPYMQDAEEIAQIKSVGLEPTRKLTNEGQAIVMAADTRIALVDCQTEHKRGKGYQTDCEERS